MVAVRCLEGGVGSKANSGVELTDFVILDRGLECEVGSAERCYDDFIS